MSNDTEITDINPNVANSQQSYFIDRKSLPLHCPLPNMSLWNSHPRVYLPIEETGQAKCPYCGTEFKLKDT
jgi:uncharacterized Zn-finger protein